MLINCSECGRKISDKAQNCPNCGAPIRFAKQERRVSDLKRSIALICWIFFGLVGGHNMYLGYKEAANIECFIFIVGLLTLFVGIGFFILVFLWIWGLLEVLTCHTDSDGAILRW